MLSLHLKPIKFVTFLLLSILIANGLGIVEGVEYSNQAKDSTEETIEIFEEALVAEKRIQVKKITVTLLVKVKKSESPAFTSFQSSATPDLFSKTSRPILHRALLI